MCLQTIDSKPRYKTATGYKIVLKQPNGSYNPELQHKYKNYILGKTAIDTAKYMISSRDKKYPTGFHVYKTLRAAEAVIKNWPEFYKYRWAILKVKLTNIVATGKQNGFTVLVGGSMSILEEVANGLDGS